MDTSEIITVTGDQSQSVDLKIRDTVNVHLRPGALIPFQDNSEMRLRTTDDLLKQPLSLIINPDAQKKAKGTVFLDQGYERKEIDNQDYEYYQIEHKASKSILFQLVKGKAGSEDSFHSIDQILIVNPDEKNDKKQFRLSCLPRQYL